MRRPHWIFLLLSLWMSLESVALGPFSAFHIHDTADVSSTALDAGGVYREADRWLPWVAGGVDRLANDLTRVHLTSLLFMALPGWLAFQVIIVLQFFLFSFFTYRLAKDRLGLEEVPAAFAGIAACVLVESYPSVLNALNHDFKMGFAILPMMVWLLERFDDEHPPAPWPAVALLGLINGTCSSFPRALPFTLTATALWFSVVRGKSSPRLWGLFLVFCLFSALPQIRVARTMVLLSSASHRADWSSSVGARQTFLIPLWTNLTLSKLCLALILAGFACARMRDKLLLRLCSALLVWSALEGTGEVSKNLNFGPLGFLKGFRFEKFSLATPLFAALAAARGIALLPRPRPALWISAAILFALSVRLKVNNVTEWYFWGGYTANYASPVYRDLALRREEPFRVASFTHGLNPSYANAYGLETVDGYLNIYPKSYQRFWSKVIEPLTSEDAYYNAYFNRSGNKVYLFLRDAEPFLSGLPLSRFYRLNLLSLANVKYLISRIPLTHPDLKPVHTPTPWPADRVERLKLRLGENFTGKTHLFVYENTKVLPRAFLARNARFFQGREELLQELSRAETRTMLETAFLETASSTTVGAGPFRPGKVSFESYRPDRLELVLETTGPALLAVTNTFSPHWTCEADGAPCRILPAYGTFWAVPLPVPTRKVVFRYAPPIGVF